MENIRDHPNVSNLTCDGIVLKYICTQNVANYERENKRPEYKGILCLFIHLNHCLFISSI